MKACSTCAAVKALDDFHRDRSRPDGRQPRCKECAIAASLASRAKRADHYRQKAREYGRANAGRRAVTTQAWRAANRPRVREINREWYLRNRDAEIARARVANAVRRGADMDVADREYAVLLLSDPCSYCGAPAESVDHIVPLVDGGDGGYSNLTAACGSCNSSKGRRSLLNHLHVGVTPKR